MQLTYTDSTWRSRSEAPTQFHCLPVQTREYLITSAADELRGAWAYETDLESDEPFDLKPTKQGPVLLDTGHLPLPEVVHRFELVAGEEPHAQPTTSWCIKSLAGKRRYSFFAESMNTSFFSADGKQQLKADPEVKGWQIYLRYDQQDIAGKTKQITFRFGDKQAETNLSNVVFSSPGLSNIAEVQFHDGYFVSAMRQEGAPDDEPALVRISQLMQAYLIEQGLANNEIRQLTPEEIKRRVFGPHWRRNSSYPGTSIHLFEEIETSDFQPYMDRAVEKEKNPNLSGALKKIDSWLEHQGGQTELRLDSIRAEDKYPVVMELRFPPAVPSGTYSGQVLIRGTNFKPVSLPFALNIVDPWEIRGARIFTILVGLICALLGAIVAHLLARSREKQPVKQVQEEALEIPRNKSPRQTNRSDLPPESYSSQNVASPGIGPWEERRR